MQSNPRILVILTATIAFGLIGCSSSEFDAAPRHSASLKGEPDAGDGEDATADKDAKDAGQGDVDGDGDDESGGVDSAVDLEDDANEADEADDEGNAEGKDSGDACRFLADTSLAEEIPGGPGIAINPNDYKEQWSREGDDIHFPLDAYKVPGEQTVQMHGGDLAEVLQNAGVADTAALPDMHFKLPSTHWQLTPISIYDLHGIPRPGGVASSSEPHYDVKYSYSVVLSNAKSKKCKLSSSLTETPFLDRTGGGCFGLSTKIRMADGQDRMIALLNVGDQVFNPATGKAVTVTAITAGPEADKSMIEIGYGRRVLRVTEGHPVPTTAGLKQAKALTRADRIQGADGAFHAVATLRRLPVDATQQVRNLVVSPDSTDARDHMLLAEGVVTGDLYLQQRLAAETVAATSGMFERIARVLADFLAF